MTKKKKTQEDVLAVEEENGEYAASRMRLLVCIVWAGLVLVHANKALGFFPLVIPDEYTYISDIRHRSFSAAVIPNYLYYVVYTLTSLSADRFLDAGRILNALFFMASAPLIHSVAKRIVSDRIALALTFVILVSPISGYTAYFMPESLYFTAFWLLAWFVTGPGAAMTPRNMAIAGAGIGLLALIKIHAIFLLPGLALFIFAQTQIADWRGRLRRTALLFCIGLLAFVVIRGGIGSLAAGSAGLHPLGQNYGAVMSAGSNAVSFFSFMKKMLYNLTGHLTGIGLLLGIPCIVAGICIARPSLFAEEKKTSLRSLAVFAFSFILPLLAVSSAFSALESELYPEIAFREITRIQWRFYNFLFPFFLLVAAGALSSIKSENADFPRAKWLFALPLACAAYAAATGFAGYALSPIPDCPELGSLHRLPAVFLLFSVICMAANIGCMIRLLPTLRAYLFIAVPLFSILGSILLQQAAVYGFGLFPNIYDKAGIFAKEYLGRECNDLTVIDGFINSAKKTLIHIDNPQTDLLPQFDNRVDMNLIQPGKNWLLLIGDFSVPAGVDKFSIVYTDPAQTNELTEYMRQQGNTRVMLRYVLMRITDFNFSVDLSGGAISWPATSVRTADGATTVDYAAPLSGRYSVSLEGDDGRVIAVDANGREIASASCESGRQATLRIPRGAEAYRLVISSRDGSPGGREKGRLRVEPFSP